MTLQKATIKNLLTGAELKVSYNPTELTFNKTAQFAEIGIPGLDSPVLQFIRGGNETLTFELFFDTTDKGMRIEATPVNEELDKLYNLVKQSPHSHATPICLFQWGGPAKEQKARFDEIQSASIPTKQKKPKNTQPNGQTSKQQQSKQSSKSVTVSNAPTWFTGVIESIERKYLLFSPNGIPLRARATVRMREYKTVGQMARPLKSADLTKARVVQRRERLEQLSTEAYDTPTEWRRIAAANDIDNPLKVTPGRVLKIPPMRTPSILRDEP